MEHQPLPPHSTRGRTYMIIVWTTFALASIVMLIRLPLRAFVRKNLGWDDFFITISWALGIFGSINATIAVHYGQGDHVEYVTNLRKLLYWLTPSVITNVPAVALAKVSICIFVLRIVGKTLRPVRLVVYADLLILIPVSVAAFFVFLLQCIPLSAAWNGPSPSSKCMNRRVLDDVTIAVGSVNAATDLITTIIPVIIISRLQIDRKRRIGLCVLIGLGILISGISVAKAVNGAVDYTNPDVSYALIPLAICGAIEHQLGIFVACLPAIVPVDSSPYRKVASYVSNVFTSTRRSDSNSERPSSCDHMADRPARPSEYSSNPSLAESGVVLESRRPQLYKPFDGMDKGVNSYQIRSFDESS